MFGDDGMVLLLAIEYLYGLGDETFKWGGVLLQLMLVFLAPYIIS